MKEQLSISSRVRRYVLRNPDVAQSLARGIVNLSSLARIICGTRLNEFDATIAALKRLRTRKEKPRSASVFTSLLKSARLVVRTRMVVVALRRSELVEQAIAQQTAEHRADISTVVMGHGMVSVTCTDEIAARVRKQCAQWFVEETRGLAQLTLLFPARTIKTIGFCSYLTGLLGAQGINIWAEATCSGEHVIVVAERDLENAIATLGV